MKRTKRLTALLLAASMTLPLLNISAAAADVTYKVGEIGDRAYVLNDDNMVDMSSPTDQVSYGKTFFYPLINETYGTGGAPSNADVQKAKEDLAAAKTAYDAALEAVKKAKQDLEALEKETAAARTLANNLTKEIKEVEEALKALESSSSSNDASAKELADKKAALKTKQDQLKAKEAELTAKRKELADKEAAQGGSAADRAAKQKTLDEKKAELAAKKTELTNMTKSLQDALDKAKAERAAYAPADTGALERALEEADGKVQTTQNAYNEAKAARDAARSAAATPAADNGADVPAAESAVSSARSVRDAAKSDRDAAKAALDRAVAYAGFDLAAYNNAKSAYDALAASTPAVAAALAAHGSPDYDAKLAEAFPDDETARASAKSTVDAWAAKQAQTPPADPGVSVDDAQAALDAAQRKLDEAEQALTTAQEALDRAKSDAAPAAPSITPEELQRLEEACDKAEKAYKDAVSAAKKAQDALTAAQGEGSAALDKAVADAQAALDAKKNSSEYKALQTAVTKLEGEVKTLGEEIAKLPANNASDSAVTALKEQIKTLETAVSTLKTDISKLEKEISALENKPATRSVTMPTVESLQKELSELKKKQEQTQKDLDAAIQKAKDEGKKVEEIEAKAADANAKLSLAQTAYNTALNSSDKVETTYPYVYETDAARSIRVRTRWEQGGSLVKNVEIVKKRLTYSGGEPQWMRSAPVSQKYAYFLAINLKPSTTTRSSDLYGNVTLNKSGTNGFEEIYLDIYANVTYPEVSGDYIPKTPALFTEDYGLTGDTEQEFRLEADDDSYFTVNTVNQNKILLGLNCDYDADIAAKFPNANLDFYNGNGGTFNRIGTMSLSADERSYIYEIKDNGTIAKVNSTYDQYEEVHSFKTRTLGRYIVSDRKLDLTVIPPSGDGSSSSSGGSSGSDGSITVLPINPNAPTVVPNPNPPTGVKL